MTASVKLRIVRPGFEPVRQAFVDNFRRRGELGAACCVYRHGEKVVDLWAGVRQRASGDPWRHDTMAIIHSTTKGLAAMVMALAHSRGLLDYDARVWAMNWRSVLHRSLIANPGTRFHLDKEHVIVRNLEAPSGGGVASAHAIAKAYGVFASGGHELGLRRETLEALMAPAMPARMGYYDACFRGPVKFSLGLMKPSDNLKFGSASAFGAPGAGGSMGYADPESDIGYGYVTNRMGMNLRGDPRDRALRSAIPRD